MTTQTESDFKEELAQEQYIFENQYGDLGTALLKYHDGNVFEATCMLEWLEDNAKLIRKYLHKPVPPTATDSFVINFATNQILNGEWPARDVERVVMMKDMLRMWEGWEPSAEEKKKGGGNDTLERED